VEKRRTHIHVVALLLAPNDFGLLADVVDSLLESQPTL
jgi:hypothetical protein